MQENFRNGAVIETQELFPLLRTQQMLAGTMVDGILASLGLFYYPIKNKTKQNKTEKRENGDISFSKSFVPTPASGFSLSLTGVDEERLGRGLLHLRSARNVFLRTQQMQAGKKVEHRNSLDGT